jgi:hypothetical protein
MSKIKNPTLFTEYFNVDVKLMDKYKLFNPVLNVDTLLFIDPLLLKRSKQVLINKKAVNQYKKQFEDIILLLSNSSKVDDIAWKNALRLLPKKEIEGTCLGYGVNSTSGRSLTEEVRIKIIQTASEIIKLGIKDSDLFMLLPLFEEKIGPDSISDITTSAIENVLLEFTYEMAKLLNIKTEKLEYKGSVQEIIKNPLKKGVSPILLLPRDILRHLPVVSNWSEISDAAAFNSNLRARVNNMISSIWKAKTKQDKAKVKHEILKNKQAIEQLLAVLKNGNVTSYDFEKDNLSLLAWQDVLSNVSTKHPFNIGKVDSSESGLKECVIKIIEQFQFLVEQKGLNKLFWKSKTEPNKEKIVQMIFFAVAYSYCKANNIDINPEMDTGNGNVDFKFSQGFSKRVIVEIKNSYNQNVISGFKTQLEIYKKSEETCFGYYIIVDVGNLGKKYDSLLKLYNADDKKKSEIIYVDAELKLSASKRK